VHQAEAEHALPMAVGDYTDFYASIHHARRVGELFRPDNPLLPNYRFVPIAYHGRSSSIVISGTPVARPQGQVLAPGESTPRVRPSARLDYELELGVVVGVGNALGDALALDDAEAHVFGLCLLNDWSARDVQGWEYQPLGPFAGKNFATTLSPWLVTLEALAPFRVPFARAEGEPAPLPYLASAQNAAAGALAITAEARLQTAAMRARGEPPQRLAQSSFADSYWTIAQMLTHHTLNGCPLRPGDVLGTGTLSGPERDQAGCLLELSQGGKAPLRLPDGEARTFLDDGDLVELYAACSAPGAVRIGFGTASGRVQPARGAE
jgi:fumarylacetoacetase